MTRFLGYVVAGLANGTIYALVALGVVVVYRISRVVNLAHGAMGVFATFCFYYVFIGNWGLPVAVAFVPVFLANLVFARRFRDVAASNLAFGANLLGAMVGGVLEYVSLITGYRVLLIVIAVLYAAAFGLQRRGGFSLGVRKLARS